MSVPFAAFLSRLDELRSELAAVCHSAGRDPASVSILPVTKNHPAEAALWVAAAGLPAVGENRVQEARAKKAEAARPGLRWELIGHLQSNKAALAAEVFDRVQSVDSIKLLERLERAAGAIARPLPILVQVNAGRDPAKFGCELEDAPALVEQALACPHLRLDGLMTIAPLDGDLAVARRCFAALRACRDGLASRFGVPLAELSMGMTGDWREAVLEGSTQIRVGTALFGVRDY